MIKLIAKITYWLTIIPPMWSAVAAAIKAVNSFVDAWKSYKDE